MKILAITDGTDWYVERFLSAIGARGHDIALVCEPGNARATHERTPGLAIYGLVEARARTDRVAMRAYREAIAGYAADVVMAYTSRVLSLVRLAVLPLPQVVIVGYRGALRGTSMFNPPDWLTYYSERVDAIACVSHAVANAMRGSLHWPRRHLASRFVTIYKGYDLLLEAEAQARAGLEVDSGGVPEVLRQAGPVCMCIGNERPIKGFRQLLDAVAMLPPSIPLSLVMVGRLADATRQRIEHDPRLAGRVWAPGYVADARRMLAQADFYIQPTQPPGEGNGNAIAEAMSHELAVITANFGGGTELVAHERTGLLVDTRRPERIAEALAHLASEPALRQALGTAARQRIASDFTLQAAVDQYLALFARLRAARLS